MGTNRTKRTFTFWRQTGNAPSGEADLKAMLAFVAPLLDDAIVCGAATKAQIQHRRRLIAKASAGDREALEQLTLALWRKPLELGGDADVNAESRTLRRHKQRGQRAQES